MKKISKPVAKSKGIKVDFTGVESRVLLPEGEYQAKVDSITLEEGNTAKYLKWTFITQDDDKKLDNQRLYYNTSLAPQALWNLRNLLETLGVDTPDGPMDLDTEACLELELLVTVTHEQYEGKTKTKISDFAPLIAKAGEEEEETEEVEEGAEEEEVAEEEVEEEETEGITAEEVKDMDDKELAALVVTHKLPVKLKAIPKASKRVAAVLDALEKAGLLSE